MTFDYSGALIRSELIIVECVNPGYGGENGHGLIEFVVYISYTEDYIVHPGYSLLHVRIDMSSVILLVQSPFFKTFFLKKNKTSKQKTPQTK